jgi:hypothetical protein
VSPGDRVTVTMPRSPSREGEYVEDRGAKCRVLLDGDKKACVVLTARCKPVPAKPPKRVSDGARCSTPGCERMRGYYLNECYEHAGPDPYAEGSPISEPTATAILAAVMQPRAVPKPPKPWRSNAYRAFVRDHSECACCGVIAGGYGADIQMEAHHHGPHAMGQKAGDETCIPLLRRCHRYFHDHGTFRDMDRAETDRVALTSQAECLIEWCRRADIDVDAVIVDALIEALRKDQT